MKVVYRIQNKKDETDGCFSGKEMNFVPDRMASHERKAYREMYYQHNPTPRALRINNPTARHYFTEEFFKKYDVVFKRMVEIFNENSERYGEFEIVEVQVSELTPVFCDDEQVLAVKKGVEINVD